MKTRATRELIAALRETRCVCGGPKGNGQSFCRCCYYALTRPQQAALYLRIGEGYAEAYLAALQQLEHADRIAQDPPPATSAAPEEQGPPPPPGDPPPAPPLGTTGGGGFG